MAGVTDTGFVVLTLDEIVEAIKTRANSSQFFGEEFPTTPDSTFGVLTGLFSAEI